MTAPAAIVVDWLSFRAAIVAAVTQAMPSAVLATCGIAWEDGPRPHARHRVLLSVVSTDSDDRDSALDEGGIQISETICNTTIPRRSSGVMFQPAPIGTDHSLKEYYYILMDVELQKFTTDPYVSLASGNLCRTISTAFRDAANNKMYILCIDISGTDAARDRT